MKCRGWLSDIKVTAAGFKASVLKLFLALVSRPDFDALLSRGAHCSPHDVLHCVKIHR